MIAALWAIWEFLVALGPFLTELGTAVAGLATALWELTKITATITLIVAAIELLFDPKGKQRVGNLIYNIIAGGLSLTSKILVDVEPGLQGIVDAFVGSMQSHGPGITTAIKKPIGDLAASAFTTADANLKAAGESTANNAAAQAAAAFSEAFGFGISSAAVTAVFEAIFPEKLNTLNGVGPALAHMAGFAEIADEVLGPLYRNAFGRSLEYKYRAQFKPELPDEADAVTWNSRRLLKDGQLKTIFDFSGLKSEYEDAFINSAYRAVSPFMLAAGFTDRDVDLTAVRRAAEFMGIRDQDMPLVLDAVEVRSLSNIRNAFVQEAMTAYGQGVISDDELNSALDDAKWGGEARSLAFKRALLLRRISLARDAESFVVPEISNGVLSDIDGINQMEAAGVQPWKAELQATKADARAAIARRKKILAEEARAAAAQRRNLTRAAVAEFQRGAIDDTGLTAALLLIPLDPLEAASIVAVQDATRQGKLKFLYGKLLTPEAAATLRIQVAAIGDQYKRQITQEGAAIGQLQGLGVDDKDIQALLAEWGALRGKPTTTGVFRPV